MYKKLLVVMVLALSAVSLLAACGPAKVTLDVDMKEFVFVPDTFTVPAGAEVTLNMTNSGTLEHEMVVMVYGKEATAPFDDDDEPNIFWEHELGMGEKGTVTFTAPTEPGEYQVVCGIAGHLEAGMKGKLIVTE